MYVFTDLNQVVSGLYDFIQVSSVAGSKRQPIMLSGPKIQTEVFEWKESHKETFIIRHVVQHR
jgi:hypothetical protein